MYAVACAAHATPLPAPLSTSASEAPLAQPPADNPVGPTLGELVLDLAVDVAEELDVSHGCLRAVLRQVRQEPRLCRVLVGHATQSLHQVRPLGADHAKQAVQRGARRRLELGHAEARRVDARGRRDPEQRLQQLG
eukprot:CAMPEP_0185308950 /NCGR_PEP_ID=MMETSP1363-20130426/21635_1 /TAXON_ID=38817 /ORGANISM="Gephyrocapsa oceanica, Strain RCC1303" /LENGTH=135 /DNA_ID=CAMNT_0027906423 /DNA_START=310 /DNA_END=714 /DNA_ORIENTATION=-